jgi:omega-amidase
VTICIGSRQRACWAGASATRKGDEHVSKTVHAISVESVVNDLPTGVLRVALGEYDTGWHDPASSLVRAGALVRAAADSGAQLVVLPEMCTTGFTMAANRYAEPLDGPSVRALGTMAAAHRVSLVAGVAIRDDTAPDGRAVNAAVLFGENGAVRASYHKQRMFAYAGEERAYSAGEEPKVVTLNGMRIALFVCYDLRFPELFRPVASACDAMVVIANWPAARRTHWDTLLRARAIENQCYVVGVNRTGHAGGIVYDGGSAAFDPWGDPCASNGAPSHVDIDLAHVRRVREEYPFLRDHRR